ncbi:MAG TPA: hypothetical protein VIV40_26810, partial [Kofleriaceae bacterium]
GSEVAYGVDLPASGVASDATRVSRAGKRVFSVPIAASGDYGINYEWNADGTAILHHGGATGEYAVTFIDADGTPTKVPLGLFFRDADSTRWTIPYLGWSKDGRRIICRTNTGFSIASINVATKQVSAPIELPTDIDFAWWDRRIATVGI